MWRDDFRLLYPTRPNDPGSESPLERKGFLACTAAFIFLEEDDCGARADCDSPYSRVWLRKNQIGICCCTDVPETWEESANRRLRVVSILPCGPRSDKHPIHNKAVNSSPS